MKKYAFLIWLFAATLMLGSTLAVAESLSITTFTDSGTDPKEDYQQHKIGQPNKLDDNGDFIKWQHHFKPPAKKIRSATLTVYLKDDGDVSPEYVFIFCEDFSFDYDKFLESFKIKIDPTYLKDGVFTVQALSLMGDFLIVKSELTIE
jgi:hypothetical protein